MTKDEKITELFKQQSRIIKCLDMIVKQHEKVRANYAWKLMNENQRNIIEELKEKCQTIEKNFILYS